MRTLYSVAIVPSVSMNRGIPGASTIYREASDSKPKAAKRGSLKASPRKPERARYQTRSPPKPEREPGQNPAPPPHPAPPRTQPRPRIQRRPARLAHTPVGGDQGVADGGAAV